MSGSSPLSSTAPSTPIRITSGLSFKRRFRPYFSKRQLSTLSSLKNSATAGAAKEAATRNTSCKFIQQVGKKLGFPQATISTAQALYHRFYLYYSIREYSPQDISVTCIFVASKIEETIKKLKDIYVAVHSVRYPDSKELDPEQVSEERRRRVIGYEKLLLETLCFDFQQRHPYEYVVKFVKWIQAFQTLDGKRLAQRAYLLAVDSYRTPLCVEYPAHTIAAGCIYLASILLRHEDELFAGLSNDKPWDQFFCSRMEDMEDVCQQILDLYIVNSPQDSERYTSIKIEINEQAQKRGPDPNMDDATKEELSARSPDWEFDGTTTPLEIVNTNQHTVCYEFSLTTT
ncbi:cyclin-like protein [Fennellomyces sp. T-0311]|nr:cyclin-like protein [Fennellomyces sp. T-0311]